MNLYPSILTDSVDQAQKQIDLVNTLFDIKIVQVDLVDGQFADNITITPADFQEVEWGEVEVDLHLMAVEPLDYVYELIEYRQTVNIRAVIAQVEKMSYQQDFIEIVKKNDWQVGLSLDLFTPLSEIDEASWNQLDVIQLMSVEAGFQGQEFHQLVFNKISELNQIIKQNNLSLELIIDGGIKPEIIDKLSDLKVTSIVVGSSLWQSKNISLTVSNFLN